MLNITLKTKQNLNDNYSQSSVFANFRYKLSVTNSSKYKLSNEYKGEYSLNPDDKTHYEGFNNYDPAAIFLDDEAYNDFYNVGYINDKATFDRLDTIRNTNLKNPYYYTKNGVDDGAPTLVESVPNNLITKELEDNLDRATTSNEYKKKEKMVEFFNKILDPNYTAGNWKSAKGTELFLKVSYAGEKYLEAHPFIHIENAEESLIAYLIVRGVKIPMNVIETSRNTSGINYTVQYPKYLLNMYGEHYKAIDGIFIPKKFYNEKTKFYTGIDTDFGDETSRNTFYENAISSLNTIYK